jgi:23S rRNA G2069 N7-methylase RlmK/C1962 C5-methylase RlmI
VTDVYCEHSINRPSISLTGFTRRTTWQEYRAVLAKSSAALKFDILIRLEQFAFRHDLSEGVQVGLFLEKRPVQIVASVYT